MGDGVLGRVAASVERDRMDVSRTCRTSGCGGDTEVVATEDPRSNLICVRAVCTECSAPWSPDGMACPQCGSTNVTSSGGGWWSCMSCNARWQI